MNPTILRQKLEELLKQLRIFDTNFDREFTQIEASWSALDHMWDGIAYEEFRARWNAVNETFRGYLHQCQRYEQFLDERIKRLVEMESGTF